MAKGIVVPWSLTEVEPGWGKKGHNLCEVGFVDKPPPDLGASEVSLWSIESLAIIATLGVGLCSNLEVEA